MASVNVSKVRVTLTGILIPVDAWTFIPADGRQVYSVGMCHSNQVAEFNSFSISRDCNLIIPEQD